MFSRPLKASGTDFTTQAHINRTAQASARRRALAPWGFLAPALLVLLGVIAYPLVDLVLLSLREELMISPAHPFVGFQNYATLNALVGLPEAALNTVVWTFGSMAGQCVVGFAAALLLNHETRAARLIRTLLLTPWVTSPVVAAVVWGWMGEPIFGVIDSLFDLHTAWLSDAHVALLSLILINIWLGYPFWMIMLASALKTVPSELYEAARIDGSAAWGRFWYVTLPSIMTVFQLTSVLAFIFTTNSFGLMQLLTGGGPGNATTTIPFAIYNLAFVQQDIGAGAALSVLLTLVMAGIVVLYFRVAQRHQVSR